MDNVYIYLPFVKCSTKDDDEEIIRCHIIMPDLKELTPLSFITNVTLKYIQSQV